jgi:beta-phosphoglucomutase-like phosphatase (HAD superfamily)
MEKLASYLSADEAATVLKRLASELGVQEVAVVTNLEYVYAPFEIYPLAPKITHDLDRIAAFAVDMDGTSTTTEPLALHSLEYMVRRFTGRLSRSDWPGLDEEKDYPYVIGNSNFRHTEFLVRRYEPWLDRDALRLAFFESLLWTLSNVDDQQRIRDVRQHAVNCGIGCVFDDPAFESLAGGGPLDEEDAAAAVRPFVETYGDKFRCESQAALVSAALDLYYARYHSILRRVERGEGQRLSKELLGEGGRRLIEPMPGYAIFIALIKGWLGDEVGSLYSDLQQCRGAEQPIQPSAEEEGRARLVRLGRRFRENPARIALVTASIAYEAHAVVKEVFNVVREQVEGWPVTNGKKRELLERFGDFRAIYDGFVTASDSSEARLKPHRDLYSIALYQMSIPKADYVRCVGLEDTEPGIIALRAAGVGCAVALPNRDTSRQNYAAASRVVEGGLPEFILGQNAMLARD